MYELASYSLRLYRHVRKVAYISTVYYIFAAYSDDFTVIFFNIVKVR